MCYNDVGSMFVVIDILSFVHLSQPEIARNLAGSSRGSLGTAGMRPRGLHEAAVNKKRFNVNPVLADSGGGPEAICPPPLIVKLNDS